MSVVGLEGWEKHPADVHVVGKDILRFHAVIWPAMLLSASLPLPKQVAANGFFTVGGVKISKSLGNAVSLSDFPRGEQTGYDALRYFLLREVPFGEDGDFSFEKYNERYNAHLANGLGNLVSRTMKMVVLGNVSPEISNNLDPTEFTMYRRHMEAFDLQKAANVIWERIRAADLYIQEHEPFRKITTDPKIARVHIRKLVVALRVITAMLEPFMPETCAKIRDTINNAREVAVPLFPRLA